MNYINEVQKWLVDHKSTTLPNWLNRNPEVKQYILDNTSQYITKNIMENVYILLHGPQPVCTYNNPRQFNTFELGYRAGCILGNKCKCVSEIRMANQKQTLLTKYGVAGVNNIPGITEKRKTTNLKKLGVEWPTQADCVKDKLKNNHLLRTAENKLEISKKSKLTSLKKYGVDHHMKLQEQKDKVAITNLMTYGAKYATQNKEISDKIVTTWQNKSEQEIQDSVNKRSDTLQLLYGVATASRIPVAKETLQILDNKEDFINFIIGKTRNEVITQLDIALHTLYLYAKKYNANELFEKPQCSLFELEVREYILSLGITIEINNRTIISPRELDIVIPSLNIAIECSGLYWHSELSAGRNKQYHYEKWKLCKDKGITLITLFDDEWKLQNIEVKQRLLHLLHRTTDKIYARNCEVVECELPVAQEFVNKFHLQKHVSAQIYLSLKYNNEVVAVMTFGAARYNKKYQYEILRFCSSVSIPGGASKLFSYFIKKFNPRSVVSYSDNRWGNGSVYTTMGFTIESVSIGYFYTDYKTRFNRVHFQKSKLISQGFDKNMSEWEIMQQRKYDRIWDCGQTQWGYTAAINTTKQIKAE